MSDASKPKLNPLSPPEKSRTYHFPGGEKVALQDVRAFASRQSGTHRLETGEGVERRLHIIPSGWLHIEIDAGDWTL